MRNTEKRRNRETGFTIVELAAVLGIIAVLTTLSVPTYNALRRRAYEAEARSFIQEIRVAAWVSWLEDGQWPAGLTDLGYSDPYSSKYFTYSIGLSGTNLVITATGKDAAAGITVIGTLTTDGQLDVQVTYATGS